MNNEELVKSIIRINHVQNIIMDGRGDSLCKEDLILGFSDSYRVTSEKDMENLKTLILPLFSSFDGFDFDGCNCDGNCSWDGLSRRCFCDNRRVSWVISENGNYAYGVAD